MKNQTYQDWVKELDKHNNKQLTNIIKEMLDEINSNDTDIQKLSTLLDLIMIIQYKDYHNDFK